MSHSEEVYYSGPVGLTPGRLGLWALIASEIVLFAGLLGSYLLLKTVRPDWVTQAAHLNIWAGALNSLILLSSNFFMMKASTAAEESRNEDTKRFLALTILLGLAFLGVKAFEYSAEFHHGFFPSTSSFWSFYFLLTGVHGLHIIGGLVAISLLLFKALSNTLEPMKGRVFLTGLYWSFVELVWIFLFPLLYLMK